MKKSILNIVENIAKNQGDRIAIKSTKGHLTYGQLWQQSDSLALWLDSELGSNRKPVMVYGHKNPQMLVCFFACVKTGRAYCPVDISMPKNRIEEIAASIGNDIVLATEDMDIDDFRVVTSGEIENICRAEAMADLKDTWVRGDDIFYIIFTSGSTGNPKGVQISESNLSSFAAWSSDMVREKTGLKAGEGINILNQAPFSFDLSVMDLYTSLSLGGTSVFLDKKLQQDTGAMFDYMRDNNINCWVSTPSFAEMCLADRSFGSGMLGELKLFLFCGERLTKETAKKLRERFPKARVVNTYGPTESTVAVTAVDITDDVIRNNEILPIGLPKDGTKIMIKDEEIIILGDTVGKGYYKNPEKTGEVFLRMKYTDGKEYDAYRTGDKGYFKDGNFYCTGRIDFQVKLHGYRIELGDIESNLMGCAEVEQAAVLPKYDGEKIRNLVAFVKAPSLEGDFKDVKYLKGRLKEKLPSYMVPKNIKFMETMPITANGKLDRKKLEAAFL